MRRIFSILLALFFGFGPLSAALPGSDDASLPACCRRHGAHHCAMMAMLSSRQHNFTPTFSAPPTCPYYPGSAITLFAPVHALAVSTAAMPSLRTHAYEHSSSPTRVASLLGRAHAGRGPPSVI